MEMIWYILLGLFTGCIGLVAIPLSHFIQQVEEESVCAKCQEESSCFARKKVLFGSNWLTEFMLCSFCIIRRRCIHAKYRYSVRDYIYILCNVCFCVVLYCARVDDFLLVLYCIATSAMFSLSVVDWRTQYIPLEWNIVVGICGIVRLITDITNWKDYIIGLIAVSGFLFLVDKIATPILAKKYQDEYEIDMVIGDGDMKLMAVTGLLIGWKLNFLALAIGCVVGSIIHLILMKIKGSERQFALGPYLSLGVYITMICGEQLISWYLNMMGGMPY